MAVIASLHQGHLATQSADRIIALRGGTLIEDAPTASFDTRAPEQICERAATAARDAGAAAGAPAHYRSSHAATSRPP